jgi:hypothetical protein
MTTMRIYKETALPGSLEPHAMYLVAPAANPNYLEVYMTNAAGTGERHTPLLAEIQAMIDSAMSGQNGLTIVDDIAGRNALTPSNSDSVLVLDASADGTVTSGGATYVYRASTTSWIKTSETESMDVTLNWSNIIGRPASSAAAIDAAVANSHTHANKTQLDKVGEDGNGEMTYNGNHIRARLESSSW